MVITSMTMSSNSNNMGQFGDTSLTKVFVGGLAWETPKEALREHYEKYGDILEAVIILDKLTGRSKGYGFVTFKDAEAAKKACEDPAPIISGRQANCKLASLGARPLRSASTTPQQGSNGGLRPASSAPPNQVHWYYPAVTPASPFHHHHHQHHHALPFYGYSPSYIATDTSYNHNVSYTDWSYVNGHFSQVYPGHSIVGANILMPMYPFYHYHPSQTMGLAAHVYPQSTAGPIATVPTIMSKPPSMASNSGACTNTFFSST